VGRRESLLLTDETLIDLTDAAVPSLVDPGFAGDRRPAIHPDPVDPDGDPPGAPGHLPGHLAGHLADPRPNEESGSGTEQESGASS